MRAVSHSATSVRVALLTALMLVGACAAQPGSTDGSTQPEAAAPPADYVTYTDHFLALQKAGLRADYAAFAKHLGAEPPASVVAALQQSFRGQPFDVYTARARTGDATHQRLMELRGTGGRLYVYMQLDRVTSGWNIGTYELDRNRGRILARL